MPRSRTPLPSLAPSFAICTTRLASETGYRGRYCVLRLTLTASWRTRSWDQTRRGVLRSSLGLAGGASVVVAVGALEPRKRHAFMIRALTPLLASGQIDLLIAGDGNERESLEKLAERREIADRVRLLGHVDDMPAVLAAADVLVHTSAVEGVPQVVLQALAAGKPVVATEMTGLREIHGAPIKISPNSPTALAATVLESIGAPVDVVDADAFRPWTCPAIDAEISAFHAELDP